MHEGNCPFHKVKIKYISKSVTQNKPNVAGHASHFSTVKCTVDFSRNDLISMPKLKVAGIASK